MSLIFTPAVNFTPVFMSDKIYDELAGLLRKSYPNVCILYIDKVSNPKLEEKFEKRRLVFGEMNQEKTLFHGTSAKAMEAITTNGYKASLNKRAVFGPGNYFSSMASYSKEYTDTASSGESYMIVNRVLLGNHTISVQGKYSGDSGGDGKTIFVLRNDDAALPEYVICFHKNAQT